METGKLKPSFQAWHAWADPWLHARSLNSTELQEGMPGTTYCRQVILLSSIARRAAGGDQCSRAGAILDGGLVEAAVPQHERQGQPGSRDASAEQPVSQTLVPHNEPAHDSATQRCSSHPTSTCVKHQLVLAQRPSQQSLQSQMHGLS